MQSSQSGPGSPDQDNEPSKKGKARVFGGWKRNYSRLQTTIDTLNLAKSAAEIIQVPLVAGALKGTCGMAISILEAVMVRLS
jgi:hypothetical protein